MKTMTLNLTDEEMEAVEELAFVQELSKTQIMKQALRIYQLVAKRAMDGETFHFSGDPQRAMTFIGPGFPIDLSTNSDA